MVISVKELDVTNKCNSRRPLLERALLSIGDVVLGISEGDGQLNQHVKISVLEIYCWPQQSLYLVTIYLMALFTKIGFLFKVMRLQFISKSLYNQYQTLYIAPTVDNYWERMKKELWKEREGKDIILSSDGRNDSPGHCAQYCTYSFVDMEAKSILKINIVDVREVEGRKSVNMERIGFERGLDEILKSQMVIKEVVTDGHLQIGALMSK